jgi:hypothetical protein
MKTGTAIQNIAMIVNVSESGMGSCIGVRKRINNLDDAKHTGNPEVVQALLTTLRRLAAFARFVDPSIT